MDIDLSDNPKLLWAGMSMYSAGQWNPTGNLNTYGLALQKILFSEDELSGGSFLPTRPSIIYPMLDEKRSWIIMGIYKRFYFFLFIYSFINFFFFFKGCYFLRLGGNLDVFMAKWKTIVKSLRQACHDIRKGKSLFNTFLCLIFIILIFSLILVRKIACKDSNQADEEEEKKSEDEEEFDDNDEDISNLKQTKRKSRLTSTYLDDEATEVENYQMEYGFANREEGEEEEEEEDEDKEELEEKEEEVEAKKFSTQPKNKSTAKK